MGIEWYDRIARKNGGYRSNAVFTIEGVSAEQLFEERLVEMLPAFDTVLDAGCGHGDFTLKMSRHAKSIVGFDNSMEMIKIANSMKDESQAVFYFPDTNEFAKFLTGIPGNPDYTDPSLSKDFDAKVEENQINGKLGVKEYKYIWKANKP
ncbi:methyltransferase domain-containing protein [Paenibacillus sp. MCAF9]|uniref:methyltransferase domain-containing protein n=1 Tax=Paenibacillus sp. MCAF9 TaxID=3233046 RepID=UPI003F9A2B9F